MLKKVKLTAALFASVFLLAACGAAESGNVVKVGVVGDIEREVWEDVEARLETDTDIDLQVEVFTDYVQPNVALADGSLDMNAFQHLAFLNDFIQSDDGADIVPAGYTYISPMAAYSEKVDSLEDLSDGAKVVIPNDATNGGRALLLLQQAGLIEIDETAGITPAVSDVTNNPKNLEFEELDAAQVPRSISDADVVIANTNYAVDADLNPYEDGIFVDTEDLHSVGSQYKNVIVVQADNTENEAIQAVIAEYQSEETSEKIKEVSNNADQKAWTEKDDIQADFTEVQENSQPAE